MIGLKSSKKIYSWTTHCFNIHSNQFHLILIDGFAKGISLLLNYKNVSPIHQTNNNKTNHLSWDDSMICANFFEQQNHKSNLSQLNEKIWIKLVLCSLLVSYISWWHTIFTTIVESMRFMQAILYVLLEVFIQTMYLFVTGIAIILKYFKIIN